MSRTSNWTQADLDKLKSRNLPKKEQVKRLRRPSVGVEAINELYKVRNGAKEHDGTKDVAKGVENKGGFKSPVNGDSAEIIQIAGVNALLIRLSGLTAGLNGSKGLMREHFSAKDKRLKTLVSRINALSTKSFYSQVIITYTRYTVRFMDWDNASASFKSLGDALEKCGIIKDDSPATIKRFNPIQEKCKRIEQRMEILIQQVVD